MLSQRTSESPLRAKFAEEARLLARDLPYHRRTRLEVAIGRALKEVDGQIEELRAGRRG